MVRKYTDFIRDVVWAGMSEYPDISVYVPGASVLYYPDKGGRYAENPVMIYSKVNRNNFFVCPSIGQVGDEEIIKREMAMYTGQVAGYEALKGNPAFASGIGPAGNQAYRPEIAPWYYIFEYGGLGAIYWDAYGSTWSVTKPSSPNPARFKNSWTPLKALDYYLGIFKSSKNILNWWSYTEGQKTMNFGKFTVTLGRGGNGWDFDNFGFAFLYDDDDIILSSSQITSPYPLDIGLSRTDGLDGFKVEYGYFDDAGEWIKSDVTPPVPVLTGNNVTVSLATGAGELSRALVRVYK
jgi:hypothetical protein